MRAHFDGIMVCLPINILLLEIAGKKDQLNLISTISIDQTIINIAEFTSSYKYISWTHTGRLIIVNTTQDSASVETAAHHRAASAEA